MRITKLVIENYNRIAKASIDFTQCDPLTMIAGRLNSAGASSNGAGKSSIINAICWVLFGRELPREGERRTAASMIREGENYVSVSIVIEDKGKPFLSVTRTRKRSGSTEILIDGERTSTSSGAQETIANRLGMTFELFTRTVVFGGDMSAFCRMSPADRTKLLEEMLGIRFYLQGAERAKEEAKTLSIQRDALVAREVTAQRDIEDARGNLQDAIATCGSRMFEHEVRESELMKDLGKLHDEMEDKEAAWREAVAAFSSRKDTYRQDLDNWKVAVKNLEEALDVCRDTQRDRESAVRNLEAEVLAAEADLRKRKQSKTPDVCPTCRRAWPATAPAPDLSGLVKQITGMRDALTKLRDAATRAKDTADAKRRELSTLRDKMPEPPAAGKAVKAAHEEMIECRTAILSVLNQLEEHRGNYDESALHAPISKAYSRLVACRAAAKDTSSQIEDLTKQIELYNYWQLAFGKDGIPSVLLESSAPALNDAVAKYSEYLTGGAYQIAFTTLVKDSGKFEFRVDASNIEGGSAYADLSKGELLRVDLCVLLAVRDLMQQRAAVRFEQSFIDELADGLDSDGTEAFVRLLRSRKLSGQVFFVSHDPTLQEAAGSVLMVSKKDGVSSVKLISSR